MKMITRRGIFLWILCILFASGLIFLTYSLASDGSDWVMKRYNRHIYSDGQLIAAGDIKDRNGVVLTSTDGESRVYSEDKQTRLATLHAVGDMKGFISTGVQANFQSELVGYNLFTGVYKNKKYGKGNDVSLTIDSEINKVAYKALGDYKGTIAVVNYKTGDIVCMVSTPSYDPENVPSDLESNSKYEGAYINRFLTGLYTPGSTFKLVTTACVLENKPEILNASWNCKKYLDVDGLEEDRIVCNARHGEVNFEEALAKSCNSAFGEIAIELGADNLKNTVEKIGLTSSVVVSDKISSAKGRFLLESNAHDTTVGWTGVGQGETLVNPASMLRFICAIANDGKAVSFNIVDDFSNQAGKTLGITFSENEVQLLSTETAQKMKQLIRNNVEHQYGDKNYKGLNLCAKSGTAQIDNVDEHNTAWFVGFMDDEQNPYAFVVVAEHGNSGSKTAGPMANKVLQALVNE